MSEKFHLKKRGLYEAMKATGAIYRASEEELAEWQALFAEEYEPASVEEKKTILMERYLSAYGGDYHAVINGMYIHDHRDLQEPLGVQTGNVRETLDPNFSSYEIDLLEVFQYGESKIVNIQPGGWGLVSLEEQDIVASSLFSCCSAVIVREKNTVAFTHVRMGDIQDTKGMTEHLTQYFTDPEIHIVTSEIEVEDEDRNQRQNNRYKKMIQDLADKSPQLHYHTYPYIVSGMKNNPFGVHSTSIMVSEHGIRLFGVKEERKKSRYNSRLTLTPINETVVDIPFAEKA